MAGGAILGDGRVGLILDAGGSGRPHGQGRGAPGRVTSMSRTLDAARASTRPLEPTDRDLSAIIQLVYERSGITLHQGKRQLVTARLQKRVREGGFGSFAAYLAHVQADASGDGDDAGCSTPSRPTTRTSSARRSTSTSWPSTSPELLARAGGGVLDGWCAACSTGEEPYTILMRLHEAGHAKVRLLASDMSTKALATARAGVYPMAKVDDVPRPLLRTYFEKGLGEQAGLARVAPRLRQPVEFRALNLLEIATLGRRVRLHLLPQRDDLLRQGRSSSGW